MSNIRGLKQLHSQKYDQMTAEELAAVLQADAEADCSSALDDETLLYIMRLYARRQKERPAKTAEEAFAVFRRDYLPRVNEPSVWTEEVLAAKPSAKIKRWLPVTAAAAALALVLGMGTVASSHFFKDGQPVYWQNRDFLIVSGNYNPEAVGNISELTKQWYPQWLPEGYEPACTYEDGEICDAQYHYVSAAAEKNSLIISFQALNAGGEARFIKNPETTKTFVHSGVRFYLFANMERNCAVGCLEGVVISIEAEIPQEEIIRIIESMQLR